MLRISFDRGTLKLDGAPPEVTRLPDVRWDPRTSCFRAPACAYGVLRRALARANVATRDEVVAVLRSPVALTPPELRQYQSAALGSWVAAQRRGIVVMPTGAGKTRVAIAAIAATRLPTLVLVPTRVLLAQWAADLASYGASAVGVLGDGAERAERITVATFESAYRKLDRHGGRFALLVIDEVHHFGTGARREALTMSVAPLRLGLTATMPTDAQHLAELEALVGPPVFQLEMAELLGHHLAELDIVRMTVTLEHDERERYDALYQRYQAAIDVLARAAPRVPRPQLAAELVRSASGRAALRARNEAERIASLPAQKRALVSALLLRHRTDPLLVFAASARDARTIAEENFVPLIVADIGRAERTEILERFRDRTYRAIASARVLNEGFDVPDASVAIVAGGSHGRREHIQRIGRVLRPAPGKRALVYELTTRGTIEERRREARRLDVRVRHP